MNDNNSNNNSNGNANNDTGSSDNVTASANDSIRQILPRLAMDYIPNASADAAKITALVKSGGSVTGYQLSDGRIVSREEGVALAKEGQIQGVGVAHKKETEYLKSIPDGTEDNNLSHLPTVRG